MTKKTSKVLAFATGIALVLAACGSDDGDSGSDASTPASEAPATEAPAADCGPDTLEGGAGGAEGEAAMSITFDISPDAVWQDGCPITVADFQCSVNSTLNTPGSISTTGYDKIISVEAGESTQQVVVTFNAVYAPYKLLFGGLIQAKAVADCNDVSADFANLNQVSGREWLMESFSPDQLVYVPNPNYWGDKPVVDRVVMVPFADFDTQSAALLAGEVDFIYPQFFAGISDALKDPNVTSQIDFGGDYEAFYLQSDPARGGPFADPIFREAFAKSIDRDAVFEQIYIPLSEGKGKLLNCGPIVPGQYCEDAFANQYDPEGASALLEANGWAKNGDGMWAKDGNVPTIRWIINTGNTRRENTQAFLIPLLQAAGFNVVADNCDAACYFQQRLPALDYDMAMYISTAPPDPAYLVSSFTCAQIPSDANNQQGQNSTGWCNEEASALLEKSDVTVDETERAQLVKDALKLMAGDYVMLPLFQFPKSGFWRTDRLGGPVGAELNNYRAFNNFSKWEDVDGDGQIVIGAEQWPECLNPVTECANSSWMVWLTAFPILPNVWDTTNDGKFVITNLVTQEPVVTVL